MDNLVTILIVVAVILFFVSRTVIQQTSVKVSRYERLQEMYARIQELKDKGLETDELKAQLKIDFDLGETEVNYLLKKSDR